MSIIQPEKKMDIESKSNEVKIAILIATTSRGTNWEKAKDSHFLSIFLQPFLKSIEQNSPIYKYEVYLGYDFDDQFYDARIDYIKKIFENTASSIKNIKIIPYKNISTGCVRAWNNLFKLAYDQGCDYFYQIGDDVVINEGGWTPVFVNKMRENNDIFICAPYDTNQPKIPTQFLVSREHMKIFGYLFPSFIENWFCDNWLCGTYFDERGAWFKTLTVTNSGGPPRYMPIMITPEKMSVSMSKSKSLILDRLKQINL